MTNATADEIAPSCILLQKANENGAPKNWHLENSVHGKCTLSCHEHYTVVTWYKNLQDWTIFVVERGDILYQRDIGNHELFLQSVMKIRRERCMQNSSIISIEWKKLHKRGVLNHVYSSYRERKYSSRDGKAQQKRLNIPKERGKLY